MDDLIELGMVDFDLIMGIDWLYSCFAQLDCRTRTVRFEFPNEPFIELINKGCIYTSKMINKGCIYHLVRVTDIDAETPTLESVPVVNEFPEVFLDELLRIPLVREIDFGIHEMPGTQPISIPPYKMAPTELNELKEQLKDLLEKGFIRPYALNRKSMGSLAHLEAYQRPLANEVHRLDSLGVRLADSSE
ncbi:uncharacterized protein [Nicotiana tomentosiformis]|uniref:uncharacterized protein n=1 Tax=Nicotiana tomentosiformis TaxID=4098 RepID=UPI00388C8C40